MLNDVRMRFGNDALMQESKAITDAGTPRNLK